MDRISQLKNWILRNDFVYIEWYKMRNTPFMDYVKAFLGYLILFGVICVFYLAYILFVVHLVGG